MLGALGLETGTYNLWLLIPDHVLELQSLRPVKNDNDVNIFLDLVDCGYFSDITLYTTVATEPLEDTDGVEDYDFDFSFTQFELDEIEQRISEMIEECEKTEEKFGTEGLDERYIAPDIPFQPDSSDIDSTETEAPVPRRRRIPPPNPPYRSRKRGRYSMLRVSYISKHCHFLACNL